MKVLIIPDVHLKPRMFDDAEYLLRETKADLAVCLGDLVDDWNCQENAGAYIRTLAAARRFAERHPETLWCYGNHDAAYLWEVWVSGTATNQTTRAAALSGLQQLYGAIPKGRVAFVHCIDHVLFSHAGISRMFVHTLFPSAYDNVPKVLSLINGLEAEDMWNDDSPLWLRPQKLYRRFPIHMYKPQTYLQVVGHSPMREITQEKNLLNCDVFSLNRDGTPFGSQEYCLLDTKTFKWNGVRAPGGKKENPENPD